LKAYNNFRLIYKALPQRHYHCLPSRGVIRLNFTAKNISKEKLPDSKFELDKEGYQETTLEELQSILGK
jgi:hypothetical protein